VVLPGDVEGVRGLLGHAGVPKTSQTTRLKTAGKSDPASADLNTLRYGKFIPPQAEEGDRRSKGVDLFLHHKGLDTSTPSGRAMFQMMGVFDSICADG
jgi:hypothetical protein